ncbi:3-hydroxyacyl-[acyl-carrier-protein] dehydratase FabZ [Bacillus rhizoplanae]|uniref:3-hydroxyacyl-[acyl-carrier-protein] dehydratase FabZ n=1 Tax=Bacillus rhizoplanae TaxID=2880966 RepID=A0ABN8A4K7_9BACI|nr:3-hydroxyacyl-ACP dehydratase FabZ family protein [Bacillus rhizoplanae]CAG9614569.1 3-hydroxyacyl-[acyl-carrier-protein] dehydratase FabZ [Bacillus rhizoplanae]
MNKVNIQSVLPHRYPFLMVDHIVEMESGKWVKGYKNVSCNEWFITESETTMPHMLIIEAIAQLGAFVSLENTVGLGFLSSLEGVEFLGSAQPGDRLDLYYEVIRNKRGFILGKGHAAVNGKKIVNVDKLLVYMESV